MSDEYCIPPIIIDQISKNLIPGKMVNAWRIGEPEGRVRQIVRAPCGTLFLDDVPFLSPMKWITVDFSDTSVLLEQCPTTSFNMDFVAPKDIRPTTLACPYAIAANSSAAYVIDYDVVPGCSLRKDFRLKIIGGGARSREIAMSMLASLSSPRFVAADENMVCIVDYVGNYTLKLFDLDGIPICPAYDIDQPRHLKMLEDRIYVVEQSGILKVFDLVKKGVLEKIHDVAIDNCRDIVINDGKICVNYGYASKYEVRYIDGNGKIGADNPWRVTARNIRPQERSRYSRSDFVCIIDYVNDTYVLKIFTHGSMITAQYAFNMPVRMVMTNNVVAVLDYANGTYALKIFNLRGRMMQIPTRITNPVDIAATSEDVLVIDKTNAGFRVRTIAGKNLTNSVNPLVKNTDAYMVATKTDIYVFDPNIGICAVHNMSRGGVYDPPPGLCKPVCIVAGPRSVYAIDMLDEHSDTVGTATTGGTVKHKPTYVVKALHQLHETFGQVPLTLKSPRHLAFIENNLYIFDLDEKSGRWSVVIWDRSYYSVPDTYPVDLTRPIQVMTDNIAIYIIDDLGG